MNLYYFQGKWSDLIDFINSKRIKADRIQHINTFVINNEVIGCMFYWGA